MKREIRIPGTNETDETLEAACSAMGYAIAHARSLPIAAEEKNRINGSLRKALADATAASSSSGGPDALRGRVANVVAHLRSSLKEMQELGGNQQALAITMRAVARALSLLYPLTQTEEPILLVARKKQLFSRRRPAVNPGVEDKRAPLFEAYVGPDTATNFFTGFSPEIASGGLFIATYNIFPVGTRFTVSTSLDGHAIFTEEGEVNWVREYNEHAPDVAPGMGVVFNRLSETAAEAINRFISSRDAIFYEAV
jgi:uncharacterized protein (TIGR02266 family)